MLRRIISSKGTKVGGLYGINLHKWVSYGMCDIETFDERKKSKLIIPIKIYEPLLPYGNTARYSNKDESGLGEILKRYKEDQEKLEKFAAFLYDKKKKNFLSVGVECNLINFEFTGEISLVSKPGDKRVQLIYPEKVKFEGEYGEVVEIQDKDSSNFPDHEFIKNLVSDVNKVIINYLSISSKPMAFMDNVMRDYNHVLVYLQEILKSNNDFISNSNSSQYTVNFPEALNKLNSLTYKNIQEVLKISKLIRKYSPFKETEEFLKCDDPILRMKLLIEFIYSLGDFIVKELHMVEEYKRDTVQKQEKFYLRFVKKSIEKIAGNESYEDYKKRFDELCTKGELTPQTKRGIEIEMELASGSSTNDGFDFEDRKKFGIVEEIFNFPWDKRDPIEFDIHHAKEVFETNLYGMEKVKDRIYEYIAKLKRTNKNSKKGFVILVTGPPGTGKTTVAQLIGKVLKRKTTVINLSGESDNITLKGSKRTYVDAQPSIFFKEIMKLGVKNPVIVLDEIDKLSSSSDFRSQTAASALLELLNPEENNNFIDQYLNIPLDFSETIFVCTANYTLQILEPLLDRIEVIEIDDYTFQDKKDISENFLIPKTLKEFGYDPLNNNHSITFLNETLIKLIKQYSSPYGGVRGIKKNIEKIIRKANFFLMQNKEISNLVIDDSYLNKFLGNTNHHDSNFFNLINNYSHPGSVLSADLKGYLVKILIKKKFTTKEFEKNVLKRIKSSEKITSKDILPKINTIFKQEKHVEESLHISINLAKTKLVEIVNEFIENSNCFSDQNIFIEKKNELLKNLLWEYNMYLTTPYSKKHGNSYGLSFYISIISSVLNLKLPEKFGNNILVVGELTPFGNVLKVKGLKYFLSICEFYDIKNVMMPEGNREEFFKYLENSKKSFENIFFIKNAEEAYQIFFSESVTLLTKNSTIHSTFSPLDNFQINNISTLH